MVNGAADKQEFVRQYMRRMCVCGRPRDEHAHFRRNGNLVVVAVAGACSGFLDAIELELGGNPLNNDLLGPLVSENFDNERRD